MQQALLRPIVLPLSDDVIAYAAAVAVAIAPQRHHVAVVSSGGS